MHATCTAFPYSWSINALDPIAGVVVGTANGVLQPCGGVLPWCRGGGHFFSPEPKSGPVTPVEPMLMADTCAPDSIKRGLSYYTGWMTSAAWTALFAAAGSLGVSYVQGCISLWHPDYGAPRWHTFLILTAFVVAVAALNIFAVRLLPILDRAAGITSMIGIVVIIIVLLACRGAKTGDFQSAGTVFGQFTNTTGWPGGFAFILGLLQSTLGLTAFDAVSHLVEEMPKPAINAPKVMVLAVIMGAITSWIFMVVLLFTLTDWDEVLNTVSGPLLTIYNQATQSRVAAQIIVMFNLFAMFVCIQCVCTVSSRVILAFARDGGLGQASRFLSPVHDRLKTPIWSVVFVSVWVVIFGLICELLSLPAIIG